MSLLLCEEPFTPVGGLCLTYDRNTWVGYDHPLFFKGDSDSGLLSIGQSCSKNHVVRVSFILFYFISFQFFSVFFSLFLFCILLCVCECGILDQDFGLNILVIIEFISHTIRNQNRFQLFFCNQKKVGNLSKRSVQYFLNTTPCWLFFRKKDKRSEIIRERMSLLNLSEIGITENFLLGKHNFFCIKTCLDITRGQFLNDQANHVYL